MGEQTNIIATFIKNIATRYMKENTQISLYCFSYASDLITGLIDKLVTKEQQYLHEVRLLDINVNEASCFITNLIKNSSDYIQFFRKILDAYKSESDKKILSDFSIDV